MIVFYNNKTGVIYGTLEGIVHNEAQKKMMIKPGEGIADEDVSKYIVSYKQNYTEKEEPIYKNFLDPATMEVIKKIVGYRKVKVPSGLEINDPLWAMFDQVFLKKESIYSFKFLVKDGLVIGYERNR